MSDTQNETAAAPVKKKGGKLKKIIVLLLLLIVVGGGGAAGGLYAMNGTIFGGGQASQEDPNQPKLVLRDGVSESAAGEARERVRAPNGRPDPRIFKATYIPLEGAFTSNMRGGDSFVQIGLGVSTYYDQRVGERLATHDMAVRSAILLALSEQDPVIISTVAGKEALKEELRNAINNVLTNREGFGGIDDVYFTSFVTQ